MERAAEAIEISERARDRFEAPDLERFDHGLFAFLDDDAFMIEAENVHVDPLAGHVERMRIRQTRARGPEDVPGLEDSRNPLDPFRVGQELAGG